MARGRPAHAGGSPQRRRPPLFGVLAALMVLGLVSSCVSAPRPTDLGSADPGSAQHLAWTPCGDGVHECGQVRVPIDHAAPDVGSLTLPLRRLPARAPLRLGTLFVDPGGPGAGSLDRGDWFAASGLEGFDIISWDPRGVAEPRVTCLNGPELDAYLALDRTPVDAQDRAALADADRRFADACAAHTPEALLRNLRTEDAARDLDIVRSAVGAEQISFYGASYSTVLGWWYGQLFPHRVGRMVLDAPVPPVRAEAAPQVVGAEANLHGFAAWCAGRDECRWGADEDAVVRTIRAWLRHLDEAPVPVGGRVLTQSLAVSGLWSGFYAGEAGWPALAEALTAARAGDGRTLLRWADAATGRRGDGSYAALVAAGTAVWCSDAPAASLFQADAAWAKARQAAPVFGELVGPDYVCAQWPVRAADSAPPVASTVPALVVVASDDPAAPSTWAKSAVASLRHPTVLTVQRYGHVSYGASRCVTTAVVAYLVRGLLPTASCSD